METVVIPMPMIDFGVGIQVDVVVAENMIGDIIANVLVAGVPYAVITAGADWDWFLRIPQEYVEYETFASTLVGLGEITLEDYEWFTEDPTPERFDEISSLGQGHATVELIGECCHAIQSKVPWRVPEVVGF